MIVRFAIDPSGIGFPSIDPALRRSLTTDILSLWRSAGVLYTGESEFKQSPLATAVANLPQELKTLWQKAIAYAYHHRLLRTGPDAWAGTFHGDGVAELACLRGLDLAAVEKDYGSLLGVPDGDYSRHFADINLEVCRLDCVSRAQAFEAATRRRDGEYEAGTAVATIWRDLFDPLIRHFQRLVLVDRYCVNELITRHDRKAGLARLVEEVDNLAGLCGTKSFRIISAIHDLPEADMVASVRTLASALPRGGIQSLELFLGPDRLFSRLMHGRYLRMDESRCLILDPGIEILGGANTYRLARYNLTSFEAPTRKSETELVAKCQRYNILSAPTTRPVAAGVAVPRLPIPPPVPRYPGRPARYH